MSTLLKCAITAPGLLLVVPIGRRTLPRIVCNCIRRRDLQEDVRTYAYTRFARGCMRTHVCMQIYFLRQSFNALHWKAHLALCTPIPVCPTKMSKCQNSGLPFEGEPYFASSQRHTKYAVRTTQKFPFLPALGFPRMFLDQNAFADQHWLPSSHRAKPSQQHQANPLSLLLAFAPSICFEPFRSIHASEP